MADPFDLLDGVLFSWAPTARPVVIVPAGGSPIAATAIIETLDELAELGGVSVEQHVMGFRFRKAEVPEQPARGWTIEDEDRDWFVVEPAQSDPRGKNWTVRASRRP